MVNIIHLILGFWAGFFAIMFVVFVIAGKPKPKPKKKECQVKSGSWIMGAVKLIVTMLKGG